MPKLHPYQIENVRPATPPSVAMPDLALNTCRTSRVHFTRPKCLSERLQWMADNLPGFREEMEQADAMERRARAARG